jgi:primosomal protein N'
VRRIRICGTVPTDVSVYHVWCPTCRGDLAYAPASRDVEVTCHRCGVAVYTDIHCAACLDQILVGLALATREVRE